jgi:diaminohydroxyphosphoribosylaminopyrimidine deaminase/5-amino-6-(5-phosphoribosylamino)uracil reductase
MLSDAEYMVRALALAERGRGRTPPNPMVGAIVVDREGVVVGRGTHERAGMPHAEILALTEAGARARGATLYCTLEPCCHTGRTGPCVERIVADGVARVVAAVEDPNPLVAGGGVRFLRERGVAVEIGQGAVEARRLNAPFFSLIQRQRPWTTMKIAMSLDGRIAARPGARTALTGPDANRFIHAIRAEVDAIGVGSGTILADDPLLTPRGPYRHRPLTRVVFDRRLRTPATARLLSTLDAGQVIIMTTEETAAREQGRVRALQAAGARLELLQQADIETAGRRLGQLGIGSLLLEGGAALHAAAWRAGLVDVVQAFITPHWLGDAGVRWMADEAFSFTALRETRTIALGADILIEGHVHRTD